MSILPSFANMVDYSSMKHSIVPRLTALCLGTKSLSVSQMFACVAMDTCVQVMARLNFVVAQPNPSLFLV